ncbi:HET-domain-containing protein [Trematosphaeria pertusa]|uniref:HET-domain-containing protein n=1 Tax=Trematosphaeria pertusa TaxID=390896 RepID=A0A6A6I622_9PLEO|nr:HET-domain-containing protein [Trematosphaeria pertusa]KAF2245985.1 HET-domain-containing protein [Trematosphaeria pertusa]
MEPCKLCNDQEKKHEDDARLAFDFTPEDLAKSAYERPCDSCMVILEGLRQSQTREWSFQRDVRRVYARCHSKRSNYAESLSLEIYFVDDRPKLELEFYSLQPHAWKAVLPRPSISGHPLSPRALAWLQSLLDECMTSHNSCKDLGQPQLPKRVLSLQSHGPHNISIRLVEPQGEFDSYAALSHCWGHEQRCTLTKSSLQARKQGIPWDTIPKTFKDAIRFCLMLGIRYIWVDSLCIIQDDEKDWEIESSKMADIYQFAYLTLAATASPGDSQGCYPETSVSADDLEIHIPEDVGACRIAVRRPLKHWDNLIPSQLKQQFPLLSRAWVFQERILSPRVLHFCKSELVWECRQLSVCECAGLGQESSPGGLFYNTIRDSGEEGRQDNAAQQERLDLILAMQLQQQEDDLELAMRLQNEGGLEENENMEDGSWAFISPLDGFPNADPHARPSDQRHVFGLPAYDAAVSNIIQAKNRPELIPHFHRTVERYSALAITKKIDRLPALSGICRRIRHLRGEYLAGLWSDSLCFDLMWRINTLSLDTWNGGRPPEYRGPTWSWVSVESPVSYWADITDFNDSDPRFRPRRADDRLGIGDDVEDYVKPVPTKPLGRNTGKVQVELNLPGHNPFGAVTSAVLTAEASCTTANLFYTYDSYWYGQTNKHDPMRYKLKVQTSDARRPSLDTRADTVEIPFFADYALGIDGPHKVAEGEMVTLLLVHPKVSLVLRRKFDEGRAITVHGGEQAWERIGIARISENLLNYYRVDWMRASEVKRFKIV